ncbi:MAG TPA: hypothetical protein VK427_03955, partial [Kofleriaceae bacterium]|nr:hypothetical protein [Kofleriaceae bacterium]
MMSTDELDDTAAALASLAPLPRERAAAEAAERTSVADPEAAQATRALLILDERRPWTLDARRALGLPAAVDDDDWHTAVRQRLALLDPAAVLDAWLDLDDGHRTVETAADALS